MAERALDTGEAYKKFREMVLAQGGDLSCIDSPEKLPQAALCGETAAESDGFLYAVDTEGIGVAAGLLGAGRETKESAVDAGAGLIMKKKVGEPVRKGETLALLYTSEKERLENAERYIKTCFEIRPERPDKKNLIVDIIR